jgi:hypothetical protein
VRQLVGLGVGSGGREGLGREEYIGNNLRVRVYSKHKRRCCEPSQRSARPRDPEEEGGERGGAGVLRKTTPDAGGGPK